MRPWARGWLLTLAAIGLLAVACSSTSPTPVPTPVGVCALVPNMDELVGKTAVDRPAGFNLNDVDRCLWTYGLDPSKSVGVSFAPIAAHGAAINSFGDGEQISGLGQDARWWASQRVLSVALDDTAVQVDLQLDQADDTKDLAVRIAQAAIANMP